MEIYYQSWPEVEKYLKNKNSLIIPIGSTEQHGPNGIIGTDFITAWEIAKKVGQNTETMVASPICYGMAQHHLGFAGSASLKPTTFITMVCEVVASYSRNGFNKFFFVNGHGGNIAPLTSAFCEAQIQMPSAEFKLFNWWHLPEVQDYEKKHFGEKNGFHATCGEISVTMALSAEANNKNMNFEYFETPKTYPWPQSAQKFRTTFPDGRMGSDPRLASKAHGEALFQIACQAISEKLRHEEKSH